MKLAVRQLFSSGSSDSELRRNASNYSTRTKRLSDRQLRIAGLKLMSSECLVGSAAVQQQAGDGCHLCSLIAVRKAVFHHCCRELRQTQICRL